MKKIIIYYFFFLLFIFSLLSSGVIDSQDGFQYLAVARNIYYTGEPTAPVYEYDTRKNIHMSTIVGKDGKTYSLTGLGYSLAYLPAVAVADIVYKIYNISPPIHFPLENDWLIFLTASFTNSFFAAFLGVILFLYLLELGLSKKQAIFISLVGLFTTNLLVYAKHSFPHMMFVTFLLLSFYLLKMHFKTKNILLLLLSGITFGVTSITYSQTFLLSVIPLGIYFLYLSNFGLKISSIRLLIPKAIFFLIGVMPFITTYFWFENLRSTATLNFGSPAIASAAASSMLRVPTGVFIEGLYGQLFSPGRSIFLYSPILLLILIFWHKIKKKWAEVWVFFTLSLISILFYSAIYNPGDPTLVPAKGVAALWHGELSWGPRYLTPLIPFGILVVGGIYMTLSKTAKLFSFYPLLILGTYVQLLGILMPYQIKLHDLEDRFFVNATEYTNFLYSNLLPRYSPVFMMSKKLVKLFQTLPNTLDHGLYNVRFYDGVDFPFSVGGERWRVIDGKGYMSFDNPQDKPVRRVTMGFINHPMEEASYSATVKVSINNQILKEKEVFLPTERKLIDLTLSDSNLQSKDNQLAIDVTMQPSQYKDDPSSYENKNVQPKKYISQILGMISFSINGSEINKESLDFPYVSTLGSKVTGIKYQNYGGDDKDPWKVWQIHTQIYERVPDFWWFKFLYYWDVPKAPLILLFAFIISLSIYTGFKTFRLLRK